MWMLWHFIYKQFAICATYIITINISNSYEKVDYIQPYRFNGGIDGILFQVHLLLGG